YNWGTLIVRNSTINDNQARYGGGIFDASPNGAGSLQGSTISGNQAEQGGGIGSAGLLLLQNSAVLSNTASDAGGGIAGSETIVVKSVISGNQAVRGGGIINWGILTAQDSTLQANAASSYGGGVMNDYSGIAVLETSTLRDNTATQAGGGVLTVNYESILALENSTLSGNQAGQGGGLYLGNNPSIAFVQNSTLAGNQAGQGGGIYAQQPGYPWSDFLSLHLLNTIVADSPSGGGLKINRHNLIEDGSCSPLLSGDPLLGPLADNGGATWTHALLDGSPAIDAGDAALYPLADQRGELRPFDGDGDGQAGCDIGAYEVMLRYDSQVTITTDLPDPSVVGQPVTVTFSMAGDPPEAGTPGGTLIVNDGVGDYCIAEASEGECTLIPTSAGDLTLTAAYAGDCNFAASSDSVAHRVDYYTMLLPLVMK
ncbi:MAG: Ig-like domain repeat protein, partial [Anaerolineales bacterium]|nr:Ig-like domain repeat protein [Anaerolineales bacterium]